MMVVPAVNIWSGKSYTRASLDSDNNVVHHEKAIFHGSPVGDEKSLVTVDWSIGIGRYMMHNGGVPCTVVYLDNEHLCIKDDVNLVRIGQKTDETGFNIEPQA